MPDVYIDRKVVTQTWSKPDYPVFVPTVLSLYHVRTVLLFQQFNLWHHCPGAPLKLNARCLMLLFPHVALYHLYLGFCFTASYIITVPICYWSLHFLSRTTGNWITQNSWNSPCVNQASKKNLRILNGGTQAASRRTDNTMTNRKRTNGQTMIYKTLHIKPKLNNHSITVCHRVTFSWC